MTARLDVTPKTTEQNRIVHIGKSEAEVTNNQKSICITFTGQCNTGRREIWQVRSPMPNFTFIGALSKNNTGMAALRAGLPVTKNITLFRLQLARDTRSTPYLAW